MTDAPAPLPSPAETAASLSAAKSAGGLAFKQEAARLQNLGVTLPAADRRLFEAMGGDTSRPTAGETMQRGGLTPTDARNQAIGDRLLAAGRDLADVRETLGDPNFVGDERSPEQIAHDRAHGMTPAVNPTSYFAQMPADVNLPPAAANALDGDARELAASIGLSPQAGSSFMRSVYVAGAELARSADPAALRQRWEQQLLQVYRDAPGQKPGTRLAEATRQVDELLRVYGGDNKLIARLREHGAIRNPTLFVNLVNRAASIARWRGTRPE